MDIFNQPFHESEGSSNVKSNKDFVRVSRKNKTITFGKTLLEQKKIGFPDGKLTFVMNLKSNPVTIIFNPPKDRVKKAMIYEILVPKESVSPSKGSSKLVDLLWKAWKLPEDVDVWDAVIEWIATDLETGIECWALKPEE